MLPSNLAQSVAGSLAAPAYTLQESPAATAPATHVFVVVPTQ